MGMIMNDHELMRTLSGRYRAKEKHGEWTRPAVASCTGMNHHGPVASRPNTKDFPESRRIALGVAVIRGRESMALSQRAFAALARIGRTSLFKLETGEPVGA